MNGILGLKYSADLRTLFFVGLNFVVIGSAWYFYPHLPWYGVMPFVIACCVLSYISAVITHNTVHVPIFRGKTANRIFQFVLSLSYGNAVSTFVTGHNLSHHMHAQTPKDPARTQKMRFKWNFLNQALFLFRMVKAILYFEDIFIKKMKKEYPRWYRQFLMESILVHGVAVILIFVDWQRWGLFIFLPRLYAVWGILGSNFFQHDGCDETSEYNHSRNFTGWFFNGLLFNNGYHTIHHMQPNLHWTLLPEYHKKLVEPYIHPNLCQNNMFFYLWKTLIWPGKRVDYLGNPLVYPPLEQDQDWSEGLNISEHEYALGAVY
jgi:fatty acid desaturase